MARARYVMKWTENGEKKQYFIYANTLRNAKAKAKDHAVKNNLGIMYSLEFMNGTEKPQPARRS